MGQRDSWPNADTPVTEKGAAEVPSSWFPERIPVLCSVLLGDQHFLLRGAHPPGQVLLGVVSFFLEKHKV